MGYIIDLNKITILRSFLINIIFTMTCLHFHGITYTLLGRPNLCHEQISYRCKKFDFQNLNPFWNSVYH